MKFVPMKTVLAGSHVYRQYSYFLRHSMVQIVFRRAVEVVRSILRGSRAISFTRTRLWRLLLVDDYLDSSMKTESFVLESSSVFNRSRDILLRIKKRIFTVPDYFALSESESLKKLVAIKTIEARRLTAFLVLFLATYYSIRIVLQLIFPSAHYRAGWAAGVALGLLLAASLKLIPRQ